MAPPELEEQRKQFKELLKADQISSSKAPYGMPMLLQKKLGQDKNFTKMDLLKGYYQVRIAEREKPKTTCMKRYGAYEWLVISFGLTNTPATFCTLMKKIFHPLLGPVRGGVF
uniref:Reverse transcriptase domain-containing protein n=1 Tax=Solanum lycopersicum TaxID=4081 RepID=A0A3Q7G1H2_SOLLC